MKESIFSENVLYTPYQPPEFLTQGYKLAESSDAWSIGMIILECLYGISLIKENFKSDSFAKRKDYIEKNVHK